MKRTSAQLHFPPKISDLPERLCHSARAMSRLGRGLRLVGLDFSQSLENLYFFSGRVSAYLGSGERYLVDDIAINGMSGGPRPSPGKKMARFPLSGSGSDLQNASVSRLLGAFR